MNDFGIESCAWEHNPVHAPRISIYRDQAGTCYQCSDGDLAQYGYTKQEAAENYWKALKR